MSVDERPTLNMSAISVAGVGGLALLAVVAIVAGALSPARWLLLGGVGGGTVLAVLLILGRRHRQIGSPRGDLPTSLFLRPSDVDLPAIDEESKSRGPLRRVSLPA
jgi:hypothetical protein